MKKTLLFVGALFCLCSLQAQDTLFTMETHDGRPIEDGDVFEFDTYGNSFSVLGWYINNPQSEAIPMKIELVSTNGADANGETNGTLCFATCYTPPVVGTAYPIDAPVMIPPGERQGSSGDHFLNFEHNIDADEDNDTIRYVFEMYQIGDRGFPKGTIRFTYLYAPKEMSVKNLNKLQISVYPTVVHEMLTVETGEKLEMKVYNLQGRLVKSEALAMGRNRIQMTNLPSQMYLVRFKNEKGEIETAKVIVD